MAGKSVLEGGFWVQHPRNVVHEVFERIQLLLYELRRREGPVVDHFSEFFETMLVHPLLLVVVAHALEIAFLLHLLYNFVEVALNVSPHASYFFEGLWNFCSLDGAYLAVAVRFLIEELQVLISNVRNVLKHFTIKVSDILSLSFVTISHILNRLVFLIVVRLQLPQGIQKAIQVLTLFLLRSTNVFG